MTTLPPCIITHSVLFDCFEAYNEDGRLVCRRGTWSNTEREAIHLGYEPVPLNSRCGRTILDKVANKTTNLGD